MKKMLYRPKKSTSKVGNILLSREQLKTITFRAGFWGPRSCKVLSILEDCLYLISLPSPSVKIQIKGGKIVQKSGVQIPVLESQFFLPFSFSFSNPPYKTK
jgi:hypothetical protein